ncbi:MAG: TonB-dependent receptor [Gemmatimonadaceae bacterium]
MAMVRCLSRVFAIGMLWVGQLGAQASTGTITGRVVDSASRQPLSAVSVRIVGTTRGALTRDDGAFTIAAVPAGTVRLRVSRIGFAPQVRDVTVSAGSSVAAQFAMPAQAAVLGELVVTGYGTQRRQSITGSVAQIDAEAANVGVINNANQMLQGRVAGVQMVTNNGEPGGGAQIRIRGGTSISGSNDPLYVVDGVPLQNEDVSAGAYGVADINPALPRSSLNSINPNDIESITVLKDASATAIYGSRGANGVVLIQTKRGSGTRAAVDYDTYFAASTPSRKLNFLNGDQYRSFIQSQVTAGTLPASRLAILGTANTNWEDELTKTGYASSHNVAFSGGSQQTQYRASLNYFDQKGVVISNGLKRYQGRLNANHTALDGRLALGLNMTASQVNNDYVANENGGGFQGGLFTNMAIFNPTQPVRVTDPKTGASSFYEIGPGSQGVRNPVGLAEQIQDNSPERRVLGNLTGTVTLIPELTAQTTLGVDYTDAVRQTYLPRASAAGASFSGLARQAERSLQNINFQQLLTYVPKFADKHDIDVVGGYEYSTFNNSGFEVVSQGFITDAFGSDNLGAGTQALSPPPNSYRQESKLVSFFSRANYGFADKYFLTGVIRYDGSSRLAPGNQWATFPAISGSWRISQEDFMRNRGFSTLALRAGYGRQGNQAVRPYATQLLLKASNDARYPFGTGITTGLVATQVANPNLKWETAEQTNVGLDFGVRNDQITGGIDVYVKNTKDLLLEVPVPQPAVVSNQIQNIGSVRNRGIEGTLDAKLIERSDRSLSSGLVLSVERNKVQNLGEDREFIITGGVFGQGQSGRNSQRIIRGEPLGTFYGPTYVGVDAQGKQLFACSRTAADCVNGQTLAPTGNDESIIGNANPKFSLGLRSNGNFKKFDASWLWRAEVGRDVFNNTALVYSTKGNALSDRNFLVSALSDPIGIAEPAIFSSRWIESGTFTRLQNVTVGYTFDLPSKLGGGRNTRVYLSGDNLLLFTPYSGYDPEVFVAAGLATRGIDYLTYPRARTFTTGARIQF